MLRVSPQLHSPPLLLPACTATHCTASPAGLLGLYRGAHLNMLKIAVASAMQLAVFDGVKARLQRDEDGWGRRHPTAALLTAAMAAGLAVTAVVQPVDVITTRVWNQPGAWWVGWGGVGWDGVHGVDGLGGGVDGGSIPSIQRLRRCCVALEGECSLRGLHAVRHGKVNVHARNSWGEPLTSAPRL